jgi:hypothetical protein
MPAEDDDAQCADHGQAQASCAATRCQVVQDDFPSWPLQGMGQNLDSPAPRFQKRI